MMKRILSIILCLTAGWICAQAQTKYRVSSFKGDVQYKQRGSDPSWKTVELDLILEAPDSISLAEGSMIRIIDTERNRIYNSRGAVKEPVYKIVNEAKNSLAARILRGMNISLRGDKRDTIAHSMKVLGAGVRGEQDIDYDELAEQLAWIGAQACSGAKSPKLEGITLKRYKLSGGELDFEFENRTEQDYHINVLHVNKRTHSVSLCYVITPEIKANACPITPSGFCSCAMDVYFPDTTDDVYILIALKEPYDSYALDNELMYHRTDKAKKTKTDILYMW